MIIRPEAANDIADVYNWYEAKRSGLGIKFQRNLDQAFRRIAVLPEGYRLVYRDVRRVLTERFPFSVYYRIEEGEIVILAVIHSRRDVGQWKRRIR